MRPYQHHLQLAYLSRAKQVSITKLLDPVLTTVVRKGRRYHAGFLQNRKIGGF